MPKVQFNTLWNSHPYPKDPCSKRHFPNQCAIRMGVAIEKAGVDTSSFDIKYPARRCYSSLEHSPKHILAAQELANWMKDKDDIFGEVDVKDDVSSKDYQGKKGVVFIRNGWGSMDHIDLWDGVAMKGGDPAYFSAGDEVWFWELG